MVRVRLLQAWKGYKVGDSVEVSKNEAFGLIDSGRAIKDKMIVGSTTKKRKRHGNTA